MESHYWTAARLLLLLIVVVVEFANLVLTVVVFFQVHLKMGWEVFGRDRKLIAMAIRFTQAQLRYARDTRLLFRPELVVHQNQVPAHAHYFRSVTQTLDLAAMIVVSQEIVKTPLFARQPLLMNYSIMLPLHVIWLGRVASLVSVLA